MLTIQFFESIRDLNREADSFQPNYNSETGTVLGDQVNTAVYVFAFLALMAIYMITTISATPKLTVPPQDEGTLALPAGSRR